MDRTRGAIVSLVVLALAACLAESAAAQQVPAELKRWIVPQAWQRDTDGPILSLGQEGEFDDTHIFAPAVVREKDRFWLWYCGARGKVNERVFQLGLSTSSDGRAFARHLRNPVYGFGDEKHSVLTPTLLKSADGAALRENGKLRMWFSSTWFEGGKQRHTLHQSSSEDGVQWERPSEPLLENVYAPTVVRTGNGYEMWYTDVGGAVWVFRHAKSADGKTWEVTEEPVLKIDQDWEQANLFYPTVLRVAGGPPSERDAATSDGTPIYLMWYGSYWSARANATALGFAVSLDGVRWHKYAGNPVFRPDPKRPWESHYTTSQSVARLADGSLRIWYASRKAPPFVNKYFAINTAVWKSADGK